MVIKNNNGNAEIWCDSSEVDKLPKEGVPPFMVAHICTANYGVTDAVFNPEAGDGGDWLSTYDGSSVTTEGGSSGGSSSQGSR